MVLGDGNHYFHALSIQLCGTQDYQLQLRKTIAAFEKSEKLVFQGLHETINVTKFEDHLRRLLFGVLTWRLLQQQHFLHLMFMLLQIATNQELLFG